MKNFSWKYLKLFFCVLVICGFTNIICAAEKQYVPFAHPDYIKDRNKQHLAITFEYNPGQLIKGVKSAELRIGSQRYNPGGDTEVVYKKNNKDVIGSYPLNDPTSTRVYSIGGDSKQKKLKATEIELFFPADREIAYVQIFYGKHGKPRGDKNIYVYEVVKKAFEIGVNKGLLHE
jgi:hypothetical protein